MKPNWAEENLQTIRTLMERSAIYRRALAPIMIFVGGLGIIGGVVGRWQRIDSPIGFFSFWSGIAIIALVGAFLLVRRQALKDSEPFWSPPTRRVKDAMAPSFYAGAMISATIVLMGDNLCPQTVFVAIWCLMFGCGIHAAGFFMQNGIRLFGWYFVSIGGGLFIALARPTIVPLQIINSPHFLMATIFGGLHLAYGIYLYFTEKRGNES